RTTCRGIDNGGTARIGTGELQTEVQALVRCVHNVRCAGGTGNGRPATRTVRGALPLVLKGGGAGPSASIGSLGLTHLKRARERRSDGIGRGGWQRGPRGLTIKNDR